MHYIKQVMKLNIVSIEGGLGNQMFQYSFYLSLKYSLFPKDFNKIFIAPYNFHNGYELDKVFRINKNIILNLSVGFIKKYFKILVLKKHEKSVATYERIRIENKKPVIYFSGYWQSEKYFSKIEDIVKSTFKFDYNKVDDNNKSLIKELEYKNSVSVHIRRGDYENDPGAKFVLGGNCSLDYYKECISYINKKINEPYFYFFSDDTEWTKENFSFVSKACFIDWNKEENSWQDMLLMSQCKHNIIANSSFSWWGAWLNSNPGKIVIAPLKWFNIYPALDIIPESWIRI